MLIMVDTYDLTYTFDISHSYITLYVIYCLHRQKDRILYQIESINHILNIICDV